MVPDYQIRLLRRDSGRTQEQAVHEMAVGKGRWYSQEPLVHYTNRLGQFARNNPLRPYDAQASTGRQEPAAKPGRPARQGLQRRLIT